MGNHLLKALQDDEYFYSLIKQAVKEGIEEAGPKQTKTANVEKFLTVKKLSAYIHTSQPNIYSMVRNEKIPFIRNGHKILFETEAIDKWLHSNSK